MLMSYGRRQGQGSEEGNIRLNVGQVRLWGGTALSLLFLALAFRGIGFRELGTALARTNYGLVLIAVGIVIAGAFVRTARWRLLFYPHHRQLRFGKLFAILLIGQMVNIIVPARLGELVRAYLLGEIEGENKARALGTIAVEKVVDMLMLLFFLIGLLLLMSLPHWVQESGKVVTIAAPVLLITLVLLAYQKEWLLSALARLLGLFPELIQARFMRQIEAALGSLDILRRWDLSLEVLGCSVLNWSLGAGINYLILLAMNIPLPFLAAVFLLLVLSLGVAVPSSPGKIGVFQYLTILALAVFGVERGLALSYSLVLHSVVFFPPSLLGAFFLWWENLDPGRLEQAARQIGVTSGDPQ